MSTQRSSQVGSVRRRSRHEESARTDSPGSGTAPEGNSGAVLGGTVRTTVDQEQVVDGQVNANVMHDVLVNAGVNLDSNDMHVVIGTPRLVSSNLTTTPDGRSMVREEEIEVRVVIRTRQQLSLFVDALASATVEGTTLTLTPRPADAPTVTTQVQGGIAAGAGNTNGGSATANPGSGS